MRFNRMTNREALEAFARREQLDQLIIRRLLSAGLIEAEDVTNLDTPDGQREFLPVSVTLKGQRLLDGKPNIHDPKHASARTRRKQLARKLSKIKITAVVTLIVGPMALFLTYKYTGAEDLRNKVYSPLNADLNTIGQTIAANSMTRPFKADSLTAIQQSGDFHRLPKSLQNELTSFYASAGQLQSDVATVTEFLQREMSSRIQPLRSEQSDKAWAERASARLRAKSQQGKGISAIVSSSFTHSAIGRGIDVRNPDNPVVALPGGPIFEINDWLSYPNSIETINPIWTTDDFLYFDETRDLWYYRITREDLEENKMTLKGFLQPVYEDLQKQKAFNALAEETKLLKQLERLKDEIGSRVNDPKRLADIFD